MRSAILPLFGSAMASLTPNDKNNEPPRICQVQEAADSESRPRTTPREDKKEKGGYECEFVEPPPKQFQSECSICLLVPREPHMVSCCGYSFCETCIGRVQRDGKPCPLCNEPGFMAMANKHLKRTLNEFQVRCPHRELGCEWIGELGKLDQHFNADPQPEHQLEGCQFTSIECIHCKNHMRRHVIAGHQNERCPKRPYTCEFCEGYKSIFEDVANHWEECKCYLLPCPNDCHPSGSGIERQNLEHHMKEECPLTVVECDFRYAGCGVKLPRKDMAVHMKEESMAHISLLAAENQRLAKKLLKRDEKMQQLMQQNTELSNRIDQQERVYQETTDQQLKATQELRKELMQQNTTLSERSDQQHSAHCVLDQKQEELRKEVTQTTDALQQQQQAHQELVQKTDQQQKASQEVIEELIQTMQQQQQSTELSNKIDQQHKAYQELAAENQRLAKQLVEKDEKMQQLQESIQQITQQNTELSNRIDQQQRAHQETTDQQQKAIQELQKELSKTKNAQQQQQRAHRELADQQQIDSQDLRKEFTQTKGTLQQWQKAHRELAGQQQKASQDLRKELAQTKGALQQQQKAHQELADQQQKASQEVLEKVSIQKKELTQTMQQQQAAHHELASRVAVQIQGLQQIKDLRQRPQLVPIIIKMAGFKKLKDTNTEWYSTPFYTHMCGYKMCLNIYACGYDNAKGTHVSVFTCLMCGEFDSHLKWPFRGDITIQLLNQLEDREHLTLIINYTDKTPAEVAARVTVGNRANGRGFYQFISHSQLKFNCTKNCQYLKDDCLLFQVLSVKIQE